MNYILEDKTPVLCSDILKWGKWFGKADRNIDKTLFKVDGVGEMGVSTIFLGIDHQYGEGDPLLFETMIFGGDLDSEMDRYSTYDQAIAGHIKMVAELKNHIIAKYFHNYQIEE